MKSVITTFFVNHYLEFFIPNQRLIEKLTLVHLVCLQDRSAHDHLESLVALVDQPVFKKIQLSFVPFTVYYLQILTLPFIPRNPIGPCGPIAPGSPTFPFKPWIPCNPICVYNCLEEKLE